MELCNFINGLSLIYNSFDNCSKIKIDAPNKNVMFMQAYEIAACMKLQESGLVQETIFLGKNQSKVFFHHTKQTQSDLCVLLKNGIYRGFDVKIGSPKCNKGASYIYMPILHKNHKGEEYFDGILNQKLLLKDYIINNQNELIKMVNKFYCKNPDPLITQMISFIKEQTSNNPELILQANAFFIKILEIQKHTKFAPILVFPFF